ncbi:hypothetical protein NC796_11280 [Aliifodinibius sp. S!AR15-10]|uniref:PHP domain-containing protein n=1 Tax=Aliifodinibius sp. S!AR15-10 TaxID=2950437 RepID=UPI00285CCCCF|nr:hypothetical protein [Aliifodinibius sp. S!AR15-10]MDR8391728.1 hypothetical protein [Aliifodinibius sp. S!AR15-10]
MTGLDKAGRNRNYDCGMRIQCTSSLTDSSRFLATTQVYVWLIGGCALATGNENWAIIDLHLHSCFSDGEHSVAEIFDRGIENNVDLVVSSDHGGVGYRRDDCIGWGEIPGTKFWGDSIVNRQGDRGMWRWTASYESSLNPSTGIRAIFREGDWTTNNQWHEMTHAIRSTDSDFYLRLHGTVHALSTPFQTDCLGRPLNDNLSREHTGITGSEHAWSDLWFYANPIFIYTD